MGDDNFFYSYDRLDATGAYYRMVFGERSNGKTYGALMKVLTNYVDNGKQGAYTGTAGAGHRRAGYKCKLRRSG